MGLLGAAILCAGGCASSARPGFNGTSGSDAGDAGEFDGGPAVATDAAPRFAMDAAPVPEPSCERELKVGKLTLSDGACFVNQHVENQTATLHFPCAGGAVTTKFGPHLFTGMVTGNHLSIRNVEPFVFNACDWISTETIEGDLATAAVTYTYSESPKVSCRDRPCTAEGKLAVTAGEVVVVK